MFIIIGPVKLKDLRVKTFDVFEDGCLQAKLFTDDGFVGEIKFDREETHSLRMEILSHPKL